MLEHPEIRPEAIAGTLSVGAQQLDRGRPGAGQRRPGHRLRRADELADRAGRRAPLRGDRPAPRAGARRSFTSATSWRRSSGSPSGTRCSATAGRWRAARWPGPTCGRSSATWSAASWTELFPKVPQEPGEPVLDLSGVRGRRLPRRADLTLRRGEILGIAGLVGAGRTELLRAVFGLDEVRSGAVTVKGVAGSAGPARRIAQGLGFLSEDRKGEGLALIRIDRGEPDRLGARPVRPARLARPPGASRARRGAGWTRSGSGRAGPISRSGRSRAATSRRWPSPGSSIRRPTSCCSTSRPGGSTSAARPRSTGSIGELAAQGRAVLLVSSYLPELMGLCDRLAVMSRGVLGPARPIAEWTEQGVMEEATGQGTAG